jgi:hypothetical protein
MEDSVSISDCPHRIADGLDYSSLSFRDAEVPGSQQPAARAKDGY